MSLLFVGDERHSVPASALPSPGAVAAALSDMGTAGAGVDRFKPFVRCVTELAGDGETPPHDEGSGNSSAAAGVDGSRAVASLPPALQLTSLILKASPVVAALPVPGDMDWLTDHKESRQSLLRFQESVRTSTVVPGSVIALIVIGSDIDPVHQHLLSRFVEAFFFGTRVVLASVSKTDLDAAIKAKKIRSRPRDDTGLGRQLWAEDLITFAHGLSQTAVAEAVRREAKAKAAKDKVGLRPAATRPPPIAATMAITLEDITKNDDWNFLYGLARSSISTGVFSLARFSPAFNGEPSTAGARGGGEDSTMDTATAKKAASQMVILHRAMKVLN